MRSPLKSGEEREREDGSGRGMEGYEGVEKNDGKDVGGEKKDQRRRIEGQKGGMKVLKGVMEQFRRKQEERDRRWQKERRGLVEGLETWRRDWS